MSDWFKYNGDDEREIPACRVIVQPGGTFEVTDPAVAKGLEGQTVFEKVTKTKDPAPRGSKE